MPISYRVLVLLQTEQKVANLALTGTLQLPMIPSVPSWALVKDHEPSIFSCCGLQ
jgi:hypothetical protein